MKISDPARGAGRGVAASREGGILKGEFMKASKNITDALVDLYPAKGRYRATYLALSKDFKPGVITMPEVTMADYEISVTEEKCELEVLFDPAGGGYRQSLKVELDAKGARELAYSLLLSVNDIE